MCGGRSRIGGARTRWERQTGELRGVGRLVVVHGGVLPADPSPPCGRASGALERATGAANGSRHHSPSDRARPFGIDSAAVHLRKKLTMCFAISRRMATDGRKIGLSDRRASGLHQLERCSAAGTRSGVAAHEDPAADPQGHHGVQHEKGEARPRAEGRPDAVGRHHGWRT